MRVWAPKDQLDQAEFAIEVAPKVLEYYEDFFKVDFPLPKQGKKKKSKVFISCIAIFLKLEYILIVYTSQYFLNLKYYFDWSF